MSPVSPISFPYMREYKTKGKASASPLQTAMMKEGLKRKRNREGFEAVPVPLKHLEHTKLISIIGRVHAFGFVVGDVHKR